RRDRLLVALVPAAVLLRHAQDRPLVHRRHGRARRRLGDRADDRRPRLDAAHERGGRGRRNPRPARAPAPDRLPARPGLLGLPPGRPGRLRNPPRRRRASLGNEHRAAVLSLLAYDAVASAVRPRRVSNSRRPVRVTLSARLSKSRLIQRFANASSSTAAPSAPPRWGRRSLQSTQAKAKRRRRVWVAGRSMPSVSKPLAPERVSA